MSTGLIRMSTAREASFLRGNVSRWTVALYQKALCDSHTFLLSKLHLFVGIPRKGLLAGMQYQAAISSAVPCMFALAWLSLARLRSQRNPKGETHTIHMRLSSLKMRHDVF